jgi:hypothetical protein
LKLTELADAQLNVPLTGELPSVSEKAACTELLLMSSLKPRVICAPTLTPVAPLAGRQEVTVGGTLSWSPLESLISSTSEAPYALSKLRVPSAMEVTVATLAESTKMSKAVLAFIPFKTIAVVPPVEARLSFADWEE